MQTRPTIHAKPRFSRRQNNLQARLLHVIVDHGLHADHLMGEGDHHEQAHQSGVPPDAGNSSAPELPAAPISEIALKPNQIGNGINATAVIR